MATKLLSTLRVLTLSIAFAAVAVASPRSEERFAAAKLESFIEAAVAVNAVVERWTPRIRSADSEQQGTALIEQARAEMASVVEATDGITLEEYHEISAAARQNPALLDRIKKMFGARAKKN